MKELCQSTLSISIFMIVAYSRIQKDLIEKSNSPIISIKKEKLKKQAQVEVTKVILSFLLIISLEVDDNVSVSVSKSVSDSICESSSEESQVGESEIKKPQPIIPSTQSRMKHSSSSELTLPPYQILKEPNNKITNFQPFIPQPNFNNFYTDPFVLQKVQELADQKKFSCNCKKSKCLKLYCECFANGEYCINCNCQDCSNVIGNEEEKDEAFKNIKDKNPVAMKLNNNNNNNININLSLSQEDNVIVQNQQGENKIGCNCTKSNCSKKYCECYKANVKCSELCRCRDCSNVSEKLKEKKKGNRKYTNNYEYEKGNINYDEENNQNYENYAFEKISVLIENKQIFINRSDIIQRNDFLKSNSSNSNNKPNNMNSNLPSLINNCPVTIKKIGDSMLIEIKKYALKDTKFETDTPNINRKRKRYKSQDSDSSTNNLLVMPDYFTKTACETVKRTKNVKQTSKIIIGKKLNLDE
jgi:hypothetical protein